MNASIGIQIVPKGKSDAEVIRIVDAVIDYIRSTGLNYFVGPLETSVEGEFGELMEIIKRCHEIAAENITRILDLQMADLNRRLKDKLISCELSAQAASFVIDNAYDPVYGARPLQRYLQQYVETLLARRLIASDPTPGTVFTVVVENDRLALA